MPQLPFKFILKTIVLFPAIFFAVWSSGFCDTSQAWLNNSATFTLSSSLGLKLSHESRHLDITYSNPYLKNIAGGVVLKLTKKIKF